MLEKALRIKNMFTFLKIHKSISLILLVLVVVCGSGIDGWAQTTGWSPSFSTGGVGGGSNDPIEELSKDVANSLYVTRGSGGAMGGNSSGIIGPVESVLRNRRGGQAEDKQLENSEISEGKSLKIRGGEKTTSFHTYVPKDAFNKLIDSKEWTRMYEDSASKGAENVISNVTWSLANSAVGEARYHAISETHQSLLNHYLSEITFIKQIEQNPYMQQEISDAYFSCVRKKMEKLSWYEAQEACMGDDGEFVDNETEKVDGKLFNFSDIADKKDGASDTKMCLTDYLFNQENKSAGISGGIDKLKAGYQSLFGDILFEIDKTSSKAKGLRKVKFNFLYPGDDLKDCKVSGVKKKTPSVLYSETLLHRYNILVKALEKYCTGVKKGSKENALKEYVDGGEFKKLVEYYNAAGFNIGIQIINNLYEKMNDNEKANKQDGKMNCEEVFKNLEAKSEKELYDFRGQNKKSKAYKAIIYNIARSVTELTLINMYTLYYSYLQNITSTKFSKSEIYQIANEQVKQVVYNALGIDMNNDIQNVIESDTQLLLNVVERLDELMDAYLKGVASELRFDGNQQEKVYESEVEFFSN